MKKKCFRVFSLVLALLLLITTVLFSAPTSIYAANDPAFNKTKLSIVVGRTATLTVNNASSAVSTVWSSSKKSVCTVSSRGVITAVAVGKAVVKCKLTFSDNSTKTLSCNVTVKKRVEGTSIQFKNLDTSEMNAQILSVGEKFTTTWQKSPSNTTDYAYFSVENTEYAKVSSSGVVTALKPGVTKLWVRLGVNQSDSERDGNKAVDSVFLLILPKEGNVTTPTPTPIYTPTPVPSEIPITPLPSITPTPIPTGVPILTPTPTPTPNIAPQVLAIQLNSSRELEIAFSTPIDDTSVIDGTERLISGTVFVTGLNNAASVGTIVPKISKDKTKLYLTTTEQFNGTYIITISENVKTVDGRSIAAYTKQCELKDKTGPNYVKTTVDDAGYLNTITFNEALDISGLQIVSVNGALNDTLKYLLQEKTNYRLSDDKKSILIDLSYGGVEKMGAAVQMTGIKDMAGNLADPWITSVNVYTDAGVKPLAKLIEIKRTSKSLLQATFDRSITYGGRLILNNVELQGVIDEKDQKIVYYTIPDTLKNLTGNQVVSLTNWSSVNANTFQSANETRYINFTLDTQPPSVIKAEMGTTTENNVSKTVLNLTYSEPVTISAITGTITAKVHGNDGTILNKTFHYTASSRDSKVILTFDVGEGTEGGVYTFTLPEGLVIDKFENFSKQQSVATNRTGDSSMTLPKPTRIEQDLTNPSVINLYFNNKLDLTSITNLSNYKFGESYPISAECVSQTETDSQIKLTFASGAFPYSTSYPFVLKGVSGYAGSYGPLQEYTGQFGLVENVTPYIKRSRLTSTSSIEVEFSENITGNCEVIVYLNGVPVACATVLYDGILYISLVNPTSSTNIYYVVTSNELYDIYNNKADIPLNTPRYVSVQ